jgi:S1-C subfamily serine protease
LKKRIISITVVFALLSAALTAALATPESPRFADVPETAWYHDSVVFAAERGFFEERGDGLFDPGGTLTLRDAAAIAERLNPEFKPETAIDETQPAARAAFAEYLYRALGDGALEPINEISDNAVRDVHSSDEYRDAVYALYRSGVLTGSDKYGRFFPERTLTRAEAAVLIHRALEPDLRRYVTFPESLAAEDIFEICRGSAFTIETYDKNGRFIRSGSGFFVSPDGLAGTCFHVLAGAYSAEVTVSGGAKYKVAGVAAYDAETNAALLSIEGDGFNWLPVADSDELKTGATAYSLGSPLGLDGTLSKGIIAYVGREVEGQKMLQFTSNISQGSGGGALLDAAGRVIGITSSSYTAGETLNLAVMSNRLTELEPGRVMTLTAVARAAESAAGNAG